MDGAATEIGYWPALLRLDAVALEASLTSAPDAAGSLEMRMVHAWLRWLQGDPPEAREAEAFSLAMSSRLPHRVIEATVLRALFALARGDLHDALLLGRRASMMARTEALPEAELLANVVLARLRRYSGKSYLAVRILEALVRQAPAFADGWIGWELLLARGTERLQTLSAPCGGGSNPVASGRRLLLAADADQPAEFARASRDLFEATARWHALAQEARCLVALLDPRALIAPSLQAFAFGHQDQLPFGLSGARVTHGDREPGTGVFAVAAPGGRGRRLLEAGLGLFGPCCRLSCDSQARREYGRTDAGLAVLVLHSPAALQEDEFFQRVYGFAYIPATHRGVLDVLLHRMRKRIAPFGSIERAEGRLGLVLQQPVAIADPRCSPAAAARILSALARQPAATAETIATALGITLRAAQAALQQLVQEGACEVRKAGRHFEYQLQDTTFAEPTGRHAGLLAPALLISHVAPPAAQPSD